MNPKSFRPATGFTLIELLCCLALIGILVAILLPAVQGIRESARRLDCTNRMRQLGLALHASESAQGHFPAGTLGTTREIRLAVDDFPAWRDDPASPYYFHNYQNTSWVVDLLPYLEQQALWMRLPDICKTPSPLRPHLEFLGDSLAAYPAGFASRHPAGVGFTFVDGSTRTLSQTMDLRLFYQQCGIADGEVQTDSGT